MKKEKKYLKPLLAVLAIFTFIGIILAIRFGNDPKAKIVKQPSSTIVIIQSDTDQIYVGYVKNDILKLLLKGEDLNENVKVYHPYKKNEYTSVNSSSIENIQVISKDELVSLYPPDKTLN